MSEGRPKGPRPGSRPPEAESNVPDAKTEALSVDEIRQTRERLATSRGAAPVRQDTSTGEPSTSRSIPAASETNFVHVPARTAKFFDRLSADDRSALESIGREVSYTFGQAILNEGDEPDGLHLLVQGRARVVKKSGRASESTLAVLEPGDVFGEGALKRAPRNASVRASGNVTTIFLPIAELDALLEDRPHLRGFLLGYGEHRRITTLLKDQGAFATLSDRTLEALIERLVPTDGSRGQTIFREGDLPGPMFIVTRGRLKVTKKTPEGPRVIAYLREGSLFGVSSSYERAPRKATVEALTDVSMLALAPQPLQELYAASPRFLQALKTHISAIDFTREAAMPLDIAELERAEAQPVPSASVGTEASVPDLSVIPGEQLAPKKKERAGAVLEPTEEEPFRSKEGYFVKKKLRSRSFPFIYQIDEMDCGAACLAMLCRYFGKRVPLGRVRALAQTNVDGVSLSNLIGAASELGLAARTARVSSHNADKMPLPAIIHWESSHWVILLEMNKRSARIADPAIGIRTITRDTLDKNWNGFAALFDFTDQFLENIEEKSGISWIVPFLRPFRGVFAASILLAAVVAALTMVLPIFTQVIVDRIVVGGASDALLALLIVMGVTFFFLITSRVLQGYLLAFVAVRVDAALFDFLTRKLLSLPMPYFLSRRTGDIQQRLDGARALRQLVISSGVQGLLASVQLVTSVALMAVYSPVLTGVFAAVTPLYVGLMVFSARVLRPVFGKLEEEFGRYRSDQLDAIKGMESVKAASAESQFREALLDRFLKMTKEQFRADYIVLTYQGLIQAVGYLSTIGFLWMGAQLALSGKLTIGGFVAFSSLVALANQPLLQLLQLWDEYQRSRALFDRMNDVLSFEPEQGRDRSKLIPVRTLSSGIEMRGLGFRYGGPESPQILRGIDLKVAPGETVAIVGRSGSGKTTLAKLISGLLEPTDGAVLFDGVDQRLLNYRDLRRHVGYVLQESHIFAGTILENIAFGEEPDLERAIVAGRGAAAHEFISKMPLGYATRIGESGIRLSGGQAQRVAIARALYKDPAIFIFDEATSALDTESERLIQNNLDSYLAGRTAFIIAHRLSTVRNANRIMVLEAGQVVEIGNHEELLKRRGVYWELVSRQVEQ